MYISVIFDGLVPESGAVSDYHELWREASLHLDLASFTERAADWLGRRLPVTDLRVWRLRRDGRKTFFISRIPAFCPMVIALKFSSRNAGF